LIREGYPPDEVVETAVTAWLDNQLESEAYEAARQNR
jgi:hypothetical protein